MKNQQGMDPSHPTAPHGLLVPFPFPDQHSFVRTILLETLFKSNPK
jgi:hypothetical protein